MKGHCLLRSCLPCCFSHLSLPTPSSTVSTLCLASFLSLAVESHELILGFDDMALGLPRVRLMLHFKRHARHARSSY